VPLPTANTGETLKPRSSSLREQGQGPSLAGQRARDINDRASKRVEEGAGAVGSGASEETEGDEYQRVREGSDGDKEGTMGRTPSSLEGP
jgi:hypothetical protein